MARHQRTTRSLLLGATALAGALALSTGSAAAQQPEYSFDLPAQPLDIALRAYARTAEQQVIFAGRDVLGRTSSPVTGKYSPEEALQIMLAGSDLTVQRTAEGVLQIARAADPQSGSAAGDGADAGTVQALVVTAQKREENIQDVPIAMSAFTQEDLTRSQVAGGPDLMTQVPNMTFTKTNFSSYSIQIRGIGTQAISATTDAAVAVAFNNTPFIRNRFFEQEFYDLQRVEVLRGPQGTLYGRNATAGVVNLISQKPKFTYEAKLAADVANYSSTRLEGMINLPLVEGKVALRLAGAWTKRDGFVANQLSGNPIDGRDLWSTRVSLRIAPTDKFDATLTWEHFKEHDDRLRSGKQLCKQDNRTEIAGYPLPGVDTSVADYGLLYNQGCLPTSLYSPEAFQAPNGYSLPYYLPLKLLSDAFKPADPYASKTQSADLRVIESQINPDYRANSDIIELQANYDLTEALKLTSETAYDYDEYWSLEDFNRFNTRPGVFNNPDQFSPPAAYRPGVMTPGPLGGIFCDPQIGCSDRLLGMDVITARSRQFSQELRLGSDFDGPFNFSLGANFLRYDTEDKYYVFINTLTLSAANPIVGTGTPGRPNPYPWIPGVSDNHQCLNGRASPDPNKPPNIYDNCIYIDPNPVGSLDDDGHNYFLSKNPYKLISYAIFGETYYNLAKDLKLTAGLRWTVDKKEAPRIPSWLLASDSVGYPVEEVVRQEWREPTGRLALDWKPDLSFTDETLVYASFAHGYKAGGTNPPRSGKIVYGFYTDTSLALVQRDATKPKTFDPEFVNAYEIGAKNTLLNGRMTANVSAFYYDYKDYQVSQIIDRSAVNYNFDAKVWGLELEADWRPLENLRLGLKGGYEATRIGNGEKAIDIMDRTAGHTDWVVARPFPTYTENCILPLDVVRRAQFFGFLNNEINNFGWHDGYMGPCEFAYIKGYDPVTMLPYVPNPTMMSSSVEGGIPPAPEGGFREPVPFPAAGQYAGFNPFDPTLGHNNGEGFYKDLGGHQLPNAPHFTATITADYTIPLPSDWLMTLHTDLYYQSEAWTRVFNMPGYDKLKAYSNVNFAAIFTNEDAGWKVMAYVKNVFDRDSITGAFLNSDDTGLTTNVFLTEPRLYGLRVTKEWSGGSWWTGANPNHPAGEPYPLTIELGGALTRNKAPYDPVSPVSITPAPTPPPDSAPPADNINPLFFQNRDMDIGQGGEVRVTWQPRDTWFVSGSARFGHAKGLDKVDGESFADSLCLPNYCIRPVYNWAKASIVNKESHTIVDFEVGRDVGLGLGLDSTVRGGLRYAELLSSTRLKMTGVFDANRFGFYDKYSAYDYYKTDITAQREFKGMGPSLTWDGARTIIGAKESGHLDLDGSITGGVLFGKQETRVTGQELTTHYFTNKYGVKTIGNPSPTPLPQRRSKSATVPMLGAAFGLSYETQRFKVSTGYRWERYFNALDTGWDKRSEVDHTIDGPYFKIAVGFGG